MYKLSGVLIGVIISVMLTINGVLANKIGNYSSIVIIHIVGIVGITIILLLKKQRLNFKNRPSLYLFSGGAIGVGLVALNNISINSIGVSLTIAIGLLGQSFAATIVDNYGLFGMEVHKLKAKKLIGFLIILIGIVVMTIF